MSVTDHNGVDSVISHISLPGVSFGELSLMYGKPRTATVTCVHDGWLWCLERKAFRGILVDRMTHDNTVKILRKVRGRLYIDYVYVCSSLLIWFVQEINCLVCR